MSDSKDDLITKYAEKRENILNELRKITNRSTFPQPDRSHLSYYQRACARDINIYFDRALVRLKNITPERDHIYFALRNKDESKNAATMSKIKSHLEFLSDLEPVINNIVDLQVLLMKGDSGAEAYENLNQSIEAFKLKHNDNFKKAKFIDSLILGINVLSAVVISVLIISLALVGMNAAVLPVFFVSMAVYAIAGLGVEGMLKKNSFTMKQSFFLDSAVEEIEAIKLDHPDLDIAKSA